MSSSNTARKKMQKQAQGGRTNDTESLVTPVISLKEARKLIGKDLSDRLSDEALGTLIGQINLIANRLLINNTVPQNQLV